MTSPKPDRPRRLARGVVLAAAVLAALTVAACEKKKKAPPPPPPPPPPAPVIPDPVDINGVLQAMRSDARVQFPQDVAPADRTLAEGVISLANALAKGDADAMRSMLTPNAATVLDNLVATGAWAEQTGSIEQVRVVTVSNTTEAEATEALVGFAIQSPDGAYLLAWNGTRDGSRWVFNNAPCQKDERPRASDFDGIVLDTTIQTPLASLTPNSGNSDRPTMPGESPSSDSDGNTGPRRKNTPGGPITIPGTPGGN